MNSHRTEPRDLSRVVADLVGHPKALPAAVVLLATWMSLPISTDVKNFAISIVTLLLLFPLQRSQNTDSKAQNLKTDELVKAVGKANSNLAGIQDRPEELE